MKNSAIMFLKKTLFGDFLELNMHLPYDPIDLFPAIYPKETKLIYTTNKTNKSMTSAALFLKPKVWGFF